MADRSKHRNDSIGGRIKLLRLDWGFTQKELATYVNKSESAVRMWELGKSEPDIETIKLLAQVFDVSTDQIIADNQELLNAIRKKQVVLTEGEELLLDLFRRVPPDRQEIVLQMIRAALETLQ